MKIFKALLLICSICILTISSSCKNEQLEALVNAENEVLPQDYGRLSVEKVVFDGDQCKYTIKAQAKYFDLTNKDDINTIKYMLDEYHFMNIDYVNSIKYNDDHINPPNTNVSKGNALDILKQCASSNTPIIYHIYSDEDPNHSVNVGSKWGSDLERFNQHFVRRNSVLSNDNFKRLFGAYNLAKMADGTNGIVTSRHYYDLTDKNQIEEIKRRVILSFVFSDEYKQLMDTIENKSHGIIEYEFYLKQKVDYDIYYDHENLKRAKISISIEELVDYARNYGI